MLQRTKNIGWILLILNLVALATIGYFSLESKPNRAAFIINQRVFNEFLGKKELERKLSQLQGDNSKSIDSLNDLIQQERNLSLIQSYQENIRQIRISEQQLSEKYTADIWRRINQYLDEYGKQEEYDFIFGALGNGSLMYGSGSNDVTDDVINFINKKYVGDE